MPVIGGSIRAEHKEARKIIRIGTRRLDPERHREGSQGAEIDRRVIYRISQRTSPAHDAGRSGGEVQRPANARDTGTQLAVKIIRGETGIRQIERHAIDRIQRGHTVAGIFKVELQ